MMLILTLLINLGGFVAIARWMWGTVARWRIWWLRKLDLDGDEILHTIQELVWYSWHKCTYIFCKCINIITGHYLYLLTNSIEAMTCIFLKIRKLILSLSNFTVLYVNKSFQWRLFSCVPLWPAGGRCVCVCVFGL